MGRTRDGAHYEWVWDGLCNRADTSSGPTPLAMIGPEKIHPNTSPASSWAERRGREKNRMHDPMFFFEIGPVIWRII